MLQYRFEVQSNFVLSQLKLITNINLFQLIKSTFMKFTISSSELSYSLNMAGAVIPNNAVLPITEDFLFDIQGDELTITATNLDNTFITKVSVSSSEDGKLALPAKILMDTMKSLPEQPVSFEVDMDTFAVELTTAFGKYKMAGDDPVDFPTPPTFEEESMIELDGSTLTRAINKTTFATSNDEIRPAMMGVYLQIDFNSIIFVATDAHKLVKYSFSNIDTDQAASFILPKKGLNLLKNTIKEDDKVQLSYTKNDVFFKANDHLIISKLIDAKYPDYNAVIPVDNPNVLKVSREALLNSLKRVNIFANKTTNQAMLNLSEGSLTISTQDIDFSNEATEQLTCDYQGEDMNIGFNAKFMAEMLSVMQDSNIELHMSTPNRAGIMVPAEQADGEDLLMLVMPVMMTH